MEFFAVEKKTKGSRMSCTPAARMDRQLGVVWFDVGERCWMCVCGGVWTSYT